MATDQQLFQPLANAIKFGLDVDEREFSRQLCGILNLKLNTHINTQTLIYIHNHKL